MLGLWHLGTVAAAGWASAGYRVVAWDPDPALRAGVEAGRGPVAEPGLDEALQDALERGRLTVVDEPDGALSAAVTVHLAFDTRPGPSDALGDERLDTAVQRFASRAPADALLLVSSQIPVGTSARWRAALETEARGLLLASVPENLRLGSGLQDFRCPARLLVGADDDAAYERASSLLVPFETRPTRLRLASAEMAKHATNAYLGLCIAFANDLAWISLAAGADPTEVSEALRADPRVAPSAPLRPGTAFSGATLSRDLTVLRALGQRHGRPDLFAAILQANERHADLALTLLAESLETLDGAEIGVVGLTYKPGTSTVRDSLPLRVTVRLLQLGATVRAWDPHAEQFKLPPGLERVPSLEECARDVDALVVLTALPELRSIDWLLLRPAHRVLVDACAGVSRVAAEGAGWTYRGLAI